VGTSVTRRRFGQLTVAGATAATLWRPQLARASHGNATTWYFAEGTTRNGFDEYLSIQNPNDVTLNVWIKYYWQNVANGRYGTTQKGPLAIQPRQRETVAVHDSTGMGLGRQYDVSAKVWTDDPRGIMVERPMYFNYFGSMGTVDGGHNVVGATEPRTTWYFAEGWTGTGFDEYLCIFNPNGAQANVRITYSMPGGVTQQKSFALAGERRATVAVHDAAYGVGRDQAVSAKVESTNGVGIVAERPMYFRYAANGKDLRDGHNVIGANAPQTAWFFAEGSTAGNYDEYLCIFNPHTSWARVRIVYYLPNGSPPQVAPEFDVPPTSRTTISVFDTTYGVGRNKDVSVKVTTTRREGIVVERPMYFPYNVSTGEANGGHSVLGATAPALNWYCAEGYTGTGFDEYLIIFNPHVPAAQVTLFWDQAPTNNPSAWSTASQALTVPGRGRILIPVWQQPGVGRDKAVAARIVSINTVGVVVERAMYFRYYTGWSGGHIAMGYSS
jgi:hypothetical protein